MATSPDEQLKSDARAVVRQLIGAGGRMTAPLREQIMALGPAAVPPLVEIFTDNTMYLLDGPGEGWAPIHAVKLLCDLRAIEAIEPLLRRLVETDFTEIVHETIVSKLPALGAPVLEPALTAYAQQQGDDARTSLAMVIGRLHVLDDRILAILLEMLAINPTVIAGVLAEYGDPAALPALMRAFDALSADATSRVPFAGVGFVEIQKAIVDLGGEFTPAQLANTRRRQAPADAFRQQMFAALEGGAPPPTLPPRARPGRNEACWCGSGKKYKKCHLDDDGG